jgi:hypothetical protein
MSRNTDQPETTQVADEIRFEELDRNDISSASAARDISARKGWRQSNSTKNEDVSSVTNKVDTSPTTIIIFFVVRTHARSRRVTAIP